MRKAIDFISVDKILDGKFKYLMVVHQGIVLNCGFAVRKVGKN